MPEDVRGVLEFAYVLENLEAEFYKAVFGYEVAEIHMGQAEPYHMFMLGEHRVAELQRLEHDAASPLGDEPVVSTLDLLVLR